MLIIRSDQMEAFKTAAVQRFEDEMVAHSKQFTPRLCKAIGDDQLRVALRQAVARADAYGFTLKGPIRTYIEMMFLWGSDFDTDPQYPRIHQILTSPGNQMRRAQMLYEFILDYQQRVSGPNASNARMALEALSTLQQQPPTLSDDHFIPEMLQQMHRCYPQKATFIGEQGLTSLVQVGCAEAANYALPKVQGELLMVVLMFAFGHGCADDPLYPWISRPLTDKRITDPDGRYQRLQNKAGRWFDEVLAGPGRGEQS